MDLVFEYFAGPPKDMYGLCKGDRECALCRRIGPCFELDCALVFDMPDGVAEGRVGCSECLKTGRFIFGHGTDIGWLDQHGLTRRYRSEHPVPPDFSQAALVTLTRTPQVDTTQEERWLTHCNDFMVYLGRWEPSDFCAHAKDGDGRALFLEMTELYPNLWDDAASHGQESWEDWGARYYAFRCRHCGAFRGNWDCD